MMPLDDDETLERELFAARAGALPAPALDVADVFARAERGVVAKSRSPENARPYLVRSAAWIGAAACAAASFLGVVSAHERTPDSTPRGVRGVPAAIASDPSGGGDEGALTCSSDIVSSPLPLASLASLASLAPAMTTDDSMCENPRETNSLVCGRDVTFSIAGP